MKANSPKRHFRFEHAGHRFTATVSSADIVFRRYRSRRTKSLTLAEAFEAAHGQKRRPLH